MAAGVLSFREGLEAALIIGIVLGALAKTGQRRHMPAVWAGVIAAVILSAGVALALAALGAELKPPAEQIFEGATLLLAAVILTWMIFWMQAHSRGMKGQIEARMQGADTWGRRGLFSLAFVAVAREGIELALYLAAAFFASSAAQTVLGAAAGLALAVAIGWLLFAGSRRVNLRRYFTVTSILLILFAAGMVAQGAAELHEAGLLPAVVDPVWSTAALLSEQSLPGSILRTLLGYSDSPFLTQLIVYAGYLAVIVGILIVRSSNRTGSREQVSRQESGSR